MMGYGIVNVFNANIYNIPLSYCFYRKLAVKNAIKELKDENIL